MVVLCGLLDVVVVEANDLLNLDSTFIRSSNKSDPYCVIEVQGASGKYRIGKTFTIDDCLNPRWYYKVTADVRHDVSGLIFTVKDRDILTSDIIGTCLVPVQFFTNGVAYSGKLSLTSPKGHPAGVLTVSVLYSNSSSASSDVSFKERAVLKAEEISRRFTKYSHKSKDSVDSSIVSTMPAFLHGALDINVNSASNLPNLDSSFLSFSKKDVSDPFVVVHLEDFEGDAWKVATTRVIDNNLNPHWNEHFHIDVCHKVTKIIFSVRDKDFLSSEMMGVVSFQAEELLRTSGIGGKFDLFRDKNGKKAGQLDLSIQYHEKAVSSTPEVPECLHPMRIYNRVCLYQDTHCCHLPIGIVNDLGILYEPRRAWKDLHEAVVNASKLIYVVGWSVSANLCLLRWEGEDTRTLGEILTQKASEGVAVRLMLWDELTSNEFKKTGTMSTEDEATSEYFKGSSVQVVLAPRDRYTKDIISTKNPFTKLCYTHHQKVLITDTPDAFGQRHLVAFVGGLDLTGGRFDTQEHCLFRTLLQEHQNDFRNRMFMCTSTSGPREPWHDIHSRVEGPVTLDLLANFEERWAKQGDKIGRLPSLQSYQGINPNYCYQNPDCWNVQMFRSINSDSAIFNWQTTGVLSNKKGRAFDNSLHKAYIHHIRRARNFIYVENQYFMGSSHEWLSCRDSKAGNLVPLEIAARIEEKIRLGERFVAYIVIPMFPEGKPADLVTQEILHWQFRTMEMMYKRIGKAIESCGIDAHPQDYLMFFCLGKKERPDCVPPQLRPPEDPVGLSAFNSRRMMIYVHSKMAVFDDEYVIVGSANINDRSLSGNRDTEIGIGAFQPNYMGLGLSMPRGSVSLFRKGLWAEHMGASAPVEMHPSSVQCAREVRRLATEGLMSYIDANVTETSRHLLLYPVNVDCSGNVSAHPYCPNIPDTTASIIGARSKVYPSSLTT